MTLQRIRLAVIFGTSLLVSACSLGSSTPTALVDPQVLADVKGIVPELQAIEAAVIAYDPTALPAAQQALIASAITDLNNGLSALNGVTTTQAGATQLKQIEADINTVLQAVVLVLPAVPQLQAFVPIADAIVALLPGIEAYVNSVIVPPTTAVAARAPLHHVASFRPAVARVILRIADYNEKAFE